MGVGVVQALMEHCPTPRPDCTGKGLGLGSRGLPGQTNRHRASDCREGGEEPWELEAGAAPGSWAAVRWHGQLQWDLEIAGRDGWVFQDEPGGGRKEDPKHELEPGSLHLGSLPWKWELPHSWWGTWK